MVFQKFRNGNFNLQDKEWITEESGRRRNETAFGRKSLSDSIRACKCTCSNPTSQNIYISLVGFKCGLLGSACAQFWKQSEMLRCYVSAIKIQEEGLFVQNSDWWWKMDPKLKRRKSWVYSGLSIDQHRKPLLCNWWDQMSVIYYELLKPGGSVNSEYYQQQLIKLNDVLQEKRFFTGARREKVILLHDNVLPHTAKTTLKSSPM